MDRAVLVGNVNALSDRVEQLVTPQRFGSWLLGGFATVGLLLGMIGVYGLLSYVLAQRTREIGVRIALGARTRDVAWLVVRGLAIAIGGGAVTGVVASWWLARLVDRMLFGIQPHDVPAFSGSIVLLLLAALVGSALPVRRATRVDPVVALRAE